MGSSNISPTRIQLKNLTNKLIIARRGHKMLKDKNDEMIRLFTSLIKKTMTARKLVEKQLNDILEQFVLSKGTMSNVEVYSTFLPVNYMINFDLDSKMNMSFPKITPQTSKQELPYSYINSSPQIDILAQKLQDFMPKIFELSTLEKSCQMLLKEIERTKRRVNALEFIMIPDLESNIKLIKFRLEENDRASRIRLIKYKDLVKNQG